MSLRDPSAATQVTLNVTRDGEEVSVTGELAAFGGRGDFPINGKPGGNGGCPGGNGRPAVGNPVAITGCRITAVATPSNQPSEHFTAGGSISFHPLLFISSSASSPMIRDQHGRCIRWSMARCHALISLVFIHAPHRCVLTLQPPRFSIAQLPPLPNMESTFGRIMHHQDEP